MRRGEIWWAELPEPVRSEPGFRRPILVIQSDDFNRSRIRTVLGAAITSNAKLTAAPGNVSLPTHGTGLPRQSVVNVSQIVTLDKSFLVKRAGRATDAVLRQVENGLRLVLSL